ncbi:MAG: SPOR domain-containing protein [Mesorhizobium sp.]
MADLKHLKVQPHGENSDTDPLAELTRIMGLAPQSGSNSGGSDDFGIDLERELIGELGANDSFAPAPVVSAPGAAPAVEAPARSFASKSVESWRSAFDEVASSSRSLPETDRARGSGDPVAAVSRPAETPARDILASRPVAPASEPPTLRRDWSAPKAPEPVAPVQRVAAPAPAPSVQAGGKPEEDPFERLAAFSREWLDRRQPDTDPSEGGRAAGSSFRMPDKPAGPASPVPGPERPTPAAESSPRPAAFQSSAPASPTAALSASSAKDRLFAAASGQLSTAAPRGVVEPAPVVAPTPADKVFDPFAELVAMAGQSRPAPAAPPSPEAGPVAPSVPLRPSPQPAPVAGGSQDAGPQSQSGVANPSIITRRTNWQSVSGGAPAFAPREATPALPPVAAAPIVAGLAASALPAAPGAAEPAMGADAFDASGPDATSDVASQAPLIEPRAAATVQQRSVEPVAETGVDEDPTWDAISAWVSRPSDRSAQPPRTAEPALDDVEDDLFLPSEAEDASVLPPVARIPELAPEVAAQDDLEDFGDDFDLESLLRSELAGEGFRADDARADVDAVVPAPAMTPARAAGEPSAQPARVAAPDVRAPEPHAPAVRVAAPAIEEPDVPTGGRDDLAMPEVDTMEVPTTPYVVADEIDVPELVVEDEVQPSIAPDDIDADFGGGFEDRAETRPAAGSAIAAATPEIWSMVAARNSASPQASPPAPVRGADVDDLDAAFDEAVRSWADAENEKETVHASAAGAAMWRNVRPETGALADDDGFDPDVQPVPAASYRTPPAQRSRGLVVAAVVAGVAVVGGIGAFMLSIGGDGGGDTPVLVRADQEPVKIKPEQPGGATVPNQDKAVYERFSSGEAASQPSQERLVSTQEEPVNLAVRTVPIIAPTPLIDPTDAESAEDLPAAFGEPVDTARPKSEDRVEPIDDFDAAPSDEVAVIAPRRVRTMVVRPDGTLVPREDIEPETVVAAAEPETPAPLAQAPIRTSEAAPAPVPASRESAASATAPVAESAAEPASAPVAAVQEPPVRAVESQTITREQATPTRGPVAPARPSDQPVEIIGNAGGAAAGTQVAAAQPAPVVAAQSSEWAMQIASQPSPEGAQASYADLSRRYGAVLNGRGVNIVKAEIAGKGTYWRVRIPAGSRAEANALCERYKAAGGSCFVSR